MLNQVVLVGRIVKQEAKGKDLYLTVAAAKSFKNNKGEYESNLIPCLLKGFIAATTQQYCNKDDIVGIKGSLENVEDKLYVLVDKVSLLSSKSNNKQKNNG